MSALKEHQRRRAGQIGLLAVLALAVAALVGCGGSDDGSQTNGRTAAAGNPPQEAGSPPQEANRGTDRPRSHRTLESGGDEGASANPMGHRGNGRDAIEEKQKGGRLKHGSGTNTVLPSKEDGRCPPNITREQCKAIAQQPVSSGPSQPVDSTTDCVEAMGEAACQQALETEKAAADAKGNSVSVENCLEERTRAQCEAQLGATLESEYAHSKGE